MDFKKLYEKDLEETKNKLRESVNEETLIIQTKEAIDDLKKTVNVLVTRLREWYGYYNPEFEKELRDNEKFSELALKEKPAKDSLGGKFEKKDIEKINDFAKEINNKYSLIKALEKYLEELMNKVCPNTITLTGVQIGAELIILARGLRRLSEMPASKIQLLGAEEALLRHLKTDSKSPKYGILFMHPLVQKSKEKGKAAKIIAEKIAIAVKIDRFKGKYFGDKLKKQVEEKISSSDASRLHSEIFHNIHKKTKAHSLNSLSEACELVNLK